MCRPLHRGYAGATGGMYVICIWGVTQGGTNHQRYVADVSAIGTMLQSGFRNKTLYSFVP